MVRFELLERRTLLSVAPAVFHLPPRHDLSSLDGYLTGPSTARPLDIALEYLSSQVGQLGLTPADLAQAAVTDL